jgi:hypothetical protein
MFGGFRLILTIKILLVGVLLVGRLWLLLLNVLHLELHQIQLDHQGYQLLIVGLLDINQLAVQGFQEKVD